jgi:hypothetical protein
VSDTVFRASSVTVTLFSRFFDVLTLFDVIFGSVNFIFESVDVFSRTSTLFKAFRRSFWERQLYFRERRRCLTLFDVLFGSVNFIFESVDVFSVRFPLLLP